MNFEGKEKETSPNPFEKPPIKERYEISDVKEFLQGRLQSFENAGDDERFKRMVAKLKEALEGLDNNNNEYALAIFKDSINRSNKSLENLTDWRERIETKEEIEKFQKMRKALSDLGE